VQDEQARVVSQLEAELQGDSSLRLALLFGSAAINRLRADSDLDVGIIPVDAELSLAGELALATRLSRATGREVDVVRLDRAPSLVRWEAARHAVVLFADSPVTATRFLARAALEHAGTEPLLDDARRRLARRLARGAA
jgi:predicted nucleotidyltransferase